MHTLSMVYDLLDITSQLRSFPSQSDKKNTQILQIMSGLFARFVKTVPQLMKVTNPPTNAFKHLSTTPKLLTARVCEPAPYFKGTAVIGNQFQEISLDTYKNKFVVLVFYPLDFTFVCPTELVAYDNEYENFQKLNTEVIGVSVDSHYSHLAWTNLGRKEGGLGPIRYPLLSDFNKAMAEDYGVLLRKEGVALRGLFIIDPKGIIRHMSVNDLPIGRSVKETLRLVEAIQFVEEHGEVCPANWNKGEKTIKPDPHGSKEYFQTVV